MCAITFLLYFGNQPVLATAFENCPDILKVDWEMYTVFFPFKAALL